MLSDSLEYLDFVKAKFSLCLLSSEIMTWSQDVKLLNPTTDSYTEMAKNKHEKIRLH